MLLKEYTGQHWSEMCEVISNNKKIHSRPERRTLDTNSGNTVRWQNLSIQSITNV